MPVIVQCHGYFKVTLCRVIKHYDDIEDQEEEDLSAHRARKHFELTFRSAVAPYLKRASVNSKTILPCKQTN